MTNQWRDGKANGAGDLTSTIRVLRREGELAARRAGLQDADVDALGVDFAAHYLGEEAAVRRDTPAYIRQAATWYACRHVRHLQKQPCQLDETLLEMEECAAPEDLVSRVVAREMLRKVEDAVRRLPPSLREIFRECILEEQSCSEAARKLGCSPAAARKRLQRLRAHLETLASPD